MLDKNDEKFGIMEEIFISRGKLLMESLGRKRENTDKQNESRLETLDLLNRAS